MSSFFRKSRIFFCIILVAIAVSGFSSYSSVDVEADNFHKENSFIKWVDLNVCDKIMKRAIELDIKYHKEGKEFRFVEALAYLATSNGNNFNFRRDSMRLNAVAKEFDKGVTIKEHYCGNKYFNRYLEIYEAVFANFVGKYVNNKGEESYGVMAYFPLAQGFWFSHYNDFGVSRNYGFKRKHLGHDIYGAIGTPIIAIEGGTITEIGWNQYGGWRVGVRSHDTRRYYYYAHLRKGAPYPKNLKLGDNVKAGQVIGFLGHTGYSKEENTNLKNGRPHLHLGLQLIFDPSQEKGSKEIWIDVYSITKFLSAHRAKVIKCPQTNTWISQTQKTPMMTLPPKG